MRTMMNGAMEKAAVSAHTATVNPAISTIRRPGLRRLTRLLLGLLALLLVAPLAGAIFQAVATELDRRAYPPPGRLVDVGGYRLHLHVMGEGHAGPTILLDAGAGGFAAQWAWVQPALAARHRVVAFDRPGLGWSEADPAGFAPERVAAAVHAALEREGIGGPYLLVGHSMGGIFARVFAGRYPAEVAGVVLVDPSHPDQLARHPALARMQADYAQQMGLLPWLARVGLTRAVDATAAMTAGLPEEQRAAFRRVTAAPRHLDAMMAELAGFEAAAAAARAAGDLGDQPLIVLSAGRAEDAPDPAAYQAGWHALHAELAALSRRGVQRVVPDAAHLSLLHDRAHAQAVVAAVDEVAAAIAAP